MEGPAARLDVKNAVVVFFCVTSFWSRYFDVTSPLLLVKKYLQFLNCAVLYFGKGDCLRSGISFRPRVFGLNTLIIKSWSETVFML